MLFTGVIALGVENGSHQNKVMIQKKQLFLLGKFENSKYPEAEIWHPESKDGRCYYVCEYFWWRFGTAPWGQLRPNLDPQFFISFYLIL